MTALKAVLPFPHLSETSLSQSSRKNPVCKYLKPFAFKHLLSRVLALDNQRQKNYRCIYSPSTQQMQQHSISEHQWSLLVLSKFCLVHRKASSSTVLILYNPNRIIKLKKISKSSKDLQLYLFTVSTLYQDHPSSSCYNKFSFGLSARTIGLLK